MSGFKVNFSVNNQLSTPSIHAAPFAQRPAAGQPGRVFIDSDNPSTGIYRDTGTTWVVIGMPSSPEADTLQIVTDRGNTTTNSITVGAATSPVGTIDVRRTTAALNGANDWALVSVNSPTIVSGASFGVNYVNAVYGSQALTFSGNATIGNTGINAAGNFINSLGNNASGTITVAQGSGTIRAIAGVQAGIYYNTPNAMTFTHVAGIKTLQPINSGAVGASVTNYYGVQIADSTPSSGTISYTNRWGIYQEGASDYNYFAGNIGINITPTSASTTSILNINNTSSSALVLSRNNASQFVFEATAAALNIYSGVSIPMLFYTSGTERMRILANGRVLIGTTVDTYALALQVNGGLWVGGATRFENGVGTPSQVNTPSISGYGTTLTFTGINSLNRNLFFKNDEVNSGAGNYITFYQNQTFNNIGTGVSNLLYFNNIVNAITAGGSINYINVNPTINQASGTGTIYGYRFNPTNTAVLSTVWAFYADSGRTYLNDVLSMGTTTPDASALLQMNSNTKGFLLPRMTAAQRDLIAAPAIGLLIFNTDTNRLNIYDGAWIAVH